MEQERSSIWTQSSFEKPKFHTHIDFDDSGVRADVIQSLEKRIPNHFLVIALIKQLCSLYIDEEEKCLETFNKICEQLANMKIIPLFALHEDFSAIREKYISAFHNVLLTTSDKKETCVKKVTDCKILCKSSASSSKILDYNATRYKEEFEEIIKLGKGGFGSVYKVKNRLDRREYAVKKVHLSEKDLANCLKVLREVKVLARLRHSNVVGYQSAWLEFVNNENSLVASSIPRISTHPDRLVDLEFESDFRKLKTEDQSESSHIVFQTSDTSIDDEKSNTSQHTFSPPPTPVSESRSNGNSLVPINNSRIHKSASDANFGRFRNSKSYKNSHHHFSPRKTRRTTLTTTHTLMNLSRRCFGIVLLIQMELCDITLRHWLQERNSQLSNNEGGLVNKKENMKIFKQIVTGVKYIHSQGLIHRDIKPNNIFLNRTKRYDDSYDYCVKIGDFGLARPDMFGEHSFATTELTSFIEPISPLFPGDTPPSSSSQTKGVGTCTYASPEQLHNRDYSSKVDIYSLGIVLFEFFQPFKTEMERHTNIKDLRKSHVPQELKNLWSEENDLILQMMAKDPESRPSADDILEMDILNEKNKCFAELMVKLEIEQKENAFLRNRIHALELELKEKDELIAQFKVHDKTL
ncbi:eukaryotic translation initiation factor 2-alpha kinase 1-like [Xenia sp. Carnegie-2017]|uniref:eukaryotic translation initiation factor 2-alpha kinase 1-like n=1 Tax=Xenia sp. Carnegie-2017 TaxID=2897299 RepID=UPI001F036BE7|nr:eukaryotic translation initiation factor 2-alpha kinase 1-like [Xenia sp. Carnegie-2017]